MSEIATRIRTRRHAWAAPGSSHDRVVGALRVLLPVLVGVLAAFLVMAPLTRRGDVSFLLDKNKVEVSKERMRTQSARYRGADAKGQPFSLTAGSAVQKNSAEPVVQLESLAANIQLADGPATMVADRGRYDMTTEQVRTVGPIRVRAANGYDLRTNDATLDLKTRKLRSGGAVKGAVPQGSFSADRLSADLESHTVTLDGNARLRIVPGRTR